MDAHLYFQKIDHFSDSDERVFAQRYFFDSRYAENASSPVIYYVCGEGNCLGEVGQGSQWNLAKALGAHLVALEHRFYGQSQPFSLLTPENLTYLSIEQALEDLGAFQRWMTKTRGVTGKWLAVGGSYPADLAAIYRFRHPDLVAGAIASSACPKFTSGGDAPDTMAARTAGPICVERYRAHVLNPMIDALNDPPSMAKIKAAFDASDIRDDLDFIGTLTGMVIFEIQEVGPRQFCESLKGDRDHDMNTFAAHLTTFLRGWETRLIDWSYEGVTSEESSRYADGIGMRQWIYQSCTEVGAFTAMVMKANPDPAHSLLTPLTDALPAKYCADYFGRRTPPVIEEMNKSYYEPLLNPTTSNILFVSGSHDLACFPYAINEANGNATNPNTRTYTIEGGLHCQDLRTPLSTDSESLKKARSLEFELSQMWLRPSPQNSR